jgi:hypothetical protein
LNCAGGNEGEKCEIIKNIELSEDEYIDLLASRLFDSNLCFSDLRYLNPQLYERIDTMVHRDHCDYFLEMREINEAAKEIIDFNEDYKELPKLSDNIFSPFMIHEILSHQDRYNNDAYLFKAFRLAVR